MRASAALTLAAAVLGAAFSAGCGRAPKPGAPTAYQAKDGSFTAKLPGNWRVDESPGETRRAAVFGPPDGPRPYSQLMGVYFHAAAEPSAEEKRYLASFQDGASPVKDTSVGGKPGLEVTTTKSAADPHLGVVRLTQRIVVVPATGGFYSLEHTWPADDEPAPAFDQLVATFQPGR